MRRGLPTEKYSPKTAIAEKTTSMYQATNEYQAEKVITSGT